MNIDFNNPLVIAGAIVAVVLIVAAIAIAVHQSRKRSADLRSRFGSEYDLALREHGARNKAEAKLLARVRRAQQLKIRELSPAEQDRYLAQWETVQSRLSTIRAEQMTEAMS